MKLHFLGAARSVTGSCHMVESGKTKLLIDCGLRQGADSKTDYGEGEFPFDPSEISFLLLTHAHIDHSGLIPLLCRKGFQGKIICTNATEQLASIMLPDSAHVQEQEAQWQSKKRLRAGKFTVEPLYTVQDALDSLKFFQPTEYNLQVDLTESIQARFIDAGHLLGSSCVELWVKEDGKTTKIVFSGDIGHHNRPIVQDPVPIYEADYVIMEGTYGDRLHKISGGVEEQLKELAEIIHSTFLRGGNLVIPSFAIGRTQEILYYIKMIIDRKMLPDIGPIPVYIDSPLGIEATNVYERCSKGYYDQEAMEQAKNGSPFRFGTLHVAETVDDSKQINLTEGSKIIISSSGMCEAGRIKHHLKHNLWRYECTVLFVGYQAAGTLGRAILDGAKKVKVLGEDVFVNARILSVEGLSGHADQKEMLQWLSAMNPQPQKVFLVHGEAAVLQKFSDIIRENGYNVTVPSLMESVDLEVGKLELSEMAKTLPQRTVKESAVVNYANELLAASERISALLDRSGEDGQVKDRDIKIKIMLQDMNAFADKWEKILKEA